MTATVLAIHTLIVLGLIVLVLLQRSDGGALGIGGGGGGGGGFMSGRGAANALTRTTTYLAAIFFATSLGLAFLAGGGESEETVIQELTGAPAVDPDAAPGATTADDLLRSLGDEADPDETTDDAAPAEDPPSQTDLLDALSSESAPETPAPAEAAGDEAEETDPPEQQ